MPDTDPESFEEFQNFLDGWRMNFDGDDYCPDCWPNYLALQSEVRHDALIDEASRTIDHASDRYYEDERIWHVFCEYCGAEITVPFDFTPALVN